MRANQRREDAGQRKTQSAGERAQLARERSPIAQSSHRRKQEGHATARTLLTRASVASTKPPRPIGAARDPTPTQPCRMCPSGDRSRPVEAASYSADERVLLCGLDQCDAIDHSFRDVHNGALHLLLLLTANLSSGCRVVCESCVNEIHLRSRSGPISCSSEMSVSPISMWMEAASIPAPLARMLRLSNSAMRIQPMRRSATGRRPRDSRSRWIAAATREALGPANVEGVNVGRPEDSQ